MSKKLNDIDRAKIRRLYLEEHLSPSTLGERFGVSRSTIDYVLKPLRRRSQSTAKQTPCKICTPPVQNLHDPRAKFAP